MTRWLRAHVQANSDQPPVESYPFGGAVSDPFKDWSGDSTTTLIFLYGISAVTIMVVVATWVFR